MNKIQLRRSPNNTAPVAGSLEQGELAWVDHSAAAGGAGGAPPGAAAPTPGGGAAAAAAMAGAAAPPPQAGPTLGTGCPFSSHTHITAFSPARPLQQGTPVLCAARSARNCWCHIL